jgi:molybdenum cofactor cytidylyltransferase
VYLLSFISAFFPELLALETHQGAKYLIRKYTKKAARVSFSQGVIDIDTPKDYEQLQQEISP